MSLKDHLFSFIYFHIEKFFYFLKIRFYRDEGDTKAGKYGINYAGYLGSEKGLGEASRAMIRIIKETDIPLALNNIEHRWQKSMETQFAAEYVRSNPYLINILHVNADMVFHVANKLGTNWLGRGHSVGYWLWELERFPEKWKSSFKPFKRIWTSSDFCNSAISKISPIPVVTMPLSVEVTTDRKYDRAFFQLNDESFVFLYVFDLMSHFERKNPLALISAFRKAFKGYRKNKVTLVLKFSGSAQNPWAHKEILKALEGLPVKIIDSYTDRDEVYGLMSVSDCYVSLHRSEGFGLTIAEAMYLGKAAIATAYSGNLQFMNRQNSLLVKYKMKKIEKDIGPYPAGYFWADPDIDHASDLMKQIYEDRKLQSELGNIAATFMRLNFTPEALKSRLEDELKNIVSAH